MFSARDAPEVVAPLAPLVVSLTADEVSLLGVVKVVAFEATDDRSDPLFADHPPPMPNKFAQRMSAKRGGICVFDHFKSPSLLSSPPAAILWRGALG
jgi:hypothetical protein